MKLKTLEQKVEAILVKYPKTRDSDRELTLAVWVNGYGVNPWSPIGEALRDNTLPSPESIGRCRRKLQETREDLRGTKKKEAVRMDAQLDFIKYAKGDTN